MRPAVGLRLAAAGVVLAAALVACDKDKDIEPPKALVAIDAKLAVEHVWSADGGVTTSPRSGGWPQVGALLVQNAIVGAAPDGTWYVAGSSSTHPVPDNLVTFTKQTPTSLGRSELMRFLFDQPPVAQEAYLRANIHPTALTFVQNGSRVAMGELKWDSCMLAERIWLMRL